MQEFILTFTRNYGAIDLKRNYQKYFSGGLLVAACLHLMLVGCYWGSVKLTHEEPPTRIVRVLDFSNIGPPPSISKSAPAVTPSVSVAGPAARMPGVGTPVPVPDANISPERTLATQAEMNAITGPIGEGEGTGNGER